MNTVTASFNTTVGQMIKMPEQKITIMSQRKKVGHHHAGVINKVLNTCWLFVRRKQSVWWPAYHTYRFRSFRETFELHDWPWCLFMHVFLSWFCFV